MPVPTHANPLQVIEAGYATAAIAAAQTRPRTNVLPVLEVRDDADYLITEGHGGLPCCERRLPNRASLA